MTVLDQYNIDSWNYLQVGYDLLEQTYNKIVYRRYITLHVAGHVSWYNAVARFSNPNAENWLEYTYYGGDYTLLQQDVTLTPTPGQQYVETVSGNLESGLVNWYFSPQITFPAMDSPATISSVEGSTLYGDFVAKFTPKSGSGYTYKLTIGIPHYNDEFSNYTSGTAVYLNNSTINAIKNVSGDTVNLNIKLSTYKNGNLVGEDTKQLNVRTNPGVHLRVNGVWKEAIPYVRINGVWKEAVPYIRVNNSWKEGI